MKQPSITAIAAHVTGWFWVLVGGLGAIAEWAKIGDAGENPAGKWIMTGLLVFGGLLIVLTWSEAHGE